MTPEQIAALEAASKATPWSLLVVGLTIGFTLSAAVHFLTIYLGPVRFIEQYLGSD